MDVRQTLMNTHAPRSLVALALCLAAPAFTGCGDITGRGPAPLERTVVAIDNHPRAGHVYCMRGWLGIFSTGMDALAQKIDTQVGVPAVSVADEEWLRLRTWLVEEHDKGAIAEPLVLLGHSYGADDSIRVAKTLKEHGIAVDLLVLIDPVTPPAVPDNVSRVFCVYKSHPLTDWYPAWRGVPATVENPATPLTNIDLRLADVGFDTEPVGHVNIEKIDGVHNMVMEEIKKTCPPRAVWLQAHPGARVTQTPAIQGTPLPGGAAGAAGRPASPTPAARAPARSAPPVTVMP
jgi:hypothetical protein